VVFSETRTHLAEAVGLSGLGRFVDFAMVYCGEDFVKESP
jgi:hypothetical protein